MARWIKYMPTLMEHEGGYCNRPNDKGGPTNMGVTLATFRRWYGADRTIADLKAITDCQWCKIMRSYWDNVKGDQIQNQSIAEIFADWHVNAGVNAIKQVQKLFGIKQDGIVGPITLGYLNSPNSEAIFYRIQDQRIAYYTRLAQADPSQQGNLNGWLKRTRSFKYKP